MYYIINIKNEYSGEDCSFCTRSKHYNNDLDTYYEKLTTLKLVNNGDIMLCSGGIFGLGRCFEDMIDLAVLLRDL